MPLLILLLLVLFAYLLKSCNSKPQSFAFASAIAIARSAHFARFFPFYQKRFLPCYFSYGRVFVVPSAATSDSFVSVVVFLSVCSCLLLLPLFAGNVVAVVEVEVQF